MDRIFKFPVGAAIFVALALAGMVGIFAAGPTQMAEAQSNSDATLSSLTVSQGTLTPGFSAAETSYTLPDLANSAESLTVTAAANNSDAEVTINGVDATSSGNSVMLRVGETTVTVTVTAADGVTTERYRIIVTRLGSQDATLKSLAIMDGDVSYLAPTFAADTEDYTAAVEHSVESVTVTAASEHDEATIVITATPDGEDAVTVPNGGLAELAEGATEIVVVVTAENGTTTKTYRIRVTRAGISSDANLESLVLMDGTTVISLVRPDGTTMGFVATETAYTATVTSSVTSVTVTAKPANRFAMVEVSRGTTQSLEHGRNAIDLTVTPENRTAARTVYSINVTRQTVRDDNHLASLSLTDDRQMTIPFDSDFNLYKVTYTAMVASSAKKVTVMTSPNVNEAEVAIAATGTGASAGTGTDEGVVTLAPAQNDETTITVTVTPASEVDDEDKVYTITVSKRDPNTDATLQTLALSEGSLKTRFDSSVANYEADVAHSVESVTVTAKARYAYATVEVDGVEVGDDGAATVDLVTMETTVTIKVTADDGSTVERYFVTITKLSASSDATLMSLDLWRAPGDEAGDPMLTTTFDPATMSYSVDVDYSDESVTVKAIPNDMGATVEVNGTAVDANGTVEVDLDEGMNTITVEVTAEDGSEMEYMITVTRAAATDTRATLRPQLVMNIQEYIAASTAERTALRPALVMLIQQYIAAPSGS